jgi:hypothetical protein
MKARKEQISFRAFSISGFRVPFSVLNYAGLKSQLPCPLDIYRIAWYEAPADPKSRLWTEHVIDSSVETVVHGLAVADMDKDGELDVVATSMYQGKPLQEVRVYLNGGKGLKWTKQVIATTGSHNIRVVDFGNDGIFSIFGANWEGSKRVDLWENVTKR